MHEVGSGVRSWTTTTPSDVDEPYRTPKGELK